MGIDDSFEMLDKVADLENNNRKKVNRRSFLKTMGKLALSAAGGAVIGAKIGHLLNTPESPHSTTETFPLPSFPELKKLDPIQRIIVVPIKEAGGTPQFTIEEEITILRNVADFFKKSSFGKVELSFELLEWQDIEDELTSNNPDLMAEKADSKLSSLEASNKLPSGVNIDDFQTRLYLVDLTGKKPISGHGAHREPYNQAWVYQSEYTGKEGAIKHELGHAFGLDHVQGYGCALDSNDFTNNCQLLDRAAGETVMGSGYNSDISGPQKFYLGWIEPDQILTLTEGYTKISLTANDVRSPNKKLLRIPKKDSDNFYYVEYCNRPRDDSTLRFYIWDEKGSMVREFYPTNSSETEDGSIFFDEINKVKVTQIKHSPTEVYLDVFIDN